jgi:CO/xanthine dehydrogenase FAD-binding subunit
MVGAVVELSADAKIAAARLAVGSCAAVARRLPALEQRLQGQALTQALADLARPDDLSPLSPIDDVRGSAAYRSDAALTLVRRALAGLAR